MCELAASREPTSPGDDDEGRITLILAYVDDVNCLVPLEDVKLLLPKFKEYGVPLGAVMNADKTRIMTSTHGHHIGGQFSKWSGLFGKRQLARCN